MNEWFFDTTQERGVVHEKLSCEQRCGPGWPDDKGTRCTSARSARGAGSGASEFAQLSGTHGHARHISLACPPGRHSGVGRGGGGGSGGGGGHTSKPWRQGCGRSPPVLG